MTTTVLSIFGSLPDDQRLPTAPLLAPLLADYSSQTVPLIRNAAVVILSIRWTLSSDKASASYRLKTEDTLGMNENSSNTGPHLDATSSQSHGWETLCASAYKSPTCIGGYDRLKLVESTDVSTI